MRGISFSILVLSVLLIRKAAWGRISRRLQYALWLLPFCYLLVSPVWSVPSSFSIENGISYLTEQWKGTETEAKGVSVPGEKAQGEQNSLDSQDSAKKPTNDSQDSAEKPTNDSQNSAEKPTNDRRDSAEKPTNDNPDGAGSQTGQDRQGSSDRQEPEKEITGREDSGKARNVFFRLTMTARGLATEGQFGKLLPYIRYGGAGGMLLWMLTVNVWFAIRCRKQRVYWGRDSQSGLKIYLLESATAPFLFLGNIYMGTDMTAEQTRFRHVVTHEMCHYRHGDNLWRFLRSLCAAFYWYNPFVWVAMEFARRDCELACDEAAIALLGQKQAKAYGYTLLSIAGKKSGKGTYFTMATTMQGSTRKLAERIRLLAEHKNPSKAVTAVVLLLTMLLTGCTFTSGKEGTQEAGKTEGVPADLPDTELEEAADDSEIEENILESDTLSAETKENARESGMLPVETKENALESGMLPAETEENVWESGALPVETKENALESDALPAETKENVWESSALSTEIIEQADNIYNTVKYRDGFFYYVDTQGIKRMEESSGKVQVIVDKPGIRNFTQDEKGTIYYSCYSEKAEGIYALYEGEQEPVKLIEWKEDFWQLPMLQAAEGIVYLELRDTCEAYQIQEYKEGEKVIRKAALLTEAENPVCQALKRCGLSGTDSSNLPIGYSVALTEYHRMVLRLPEKQTLNLYDTENGQRIAKLTECQNDILMMPQGVIYKKQTGDIYFRSWIKGENANQLLYQPAAHEGKAINYGTYDAGYLYGFWEEAGTSTLVRISFADNIRAVQKLNTFTGVNRAVDLGLSVSHDMIFYWKDDKIVWKEPKGITEE